MKKTLIIACALTIALSSASFAATVSKNVGGATVTVTKDTSKIDNKVKQAQNDKAKIDKARKDAKKVSKEEVKSQAKTQAKKQAKKQVNKKLNQTVNKKSPVKVNVK